jgi:hypothetical protein
MSLSWTRLGRHGDREVHLHGGGWSHWHRAPTLPVVERERPFDEATPL